MKRKSILVLAMVVLFFGFLPNTFATTANFQGLGDLPGGLFYSWANDVSADGSVVVGWSTRGEPVMLLLLGLGGVVVLRRRWA